MEIFLILIFLYLLMNGLLLPALFWSFKVLFWLFCIVLVCKVIGCLAEDTPKKEVSDLPSFWYFVCFFCIVLFFQVISCEDKGKQKFVKPLKDESSVLYDLEDALDDAEEDLKEALDDLEEARDDYDDTYRDYQKAPL